MTDNSGETSDVAIAMSVMFKAQRPTTPSECTPKIRKRLESVNTDSPVSIINYKQERAEQNRTNIIESRVRALSDADEMRLQKLEAISEETKTKAMRYQNSQSRAAKNRHRLLSQRSSKLRSRHHRIQSVISEKKEEEITAKTQLSVIFEKRAKEAARNHEEHLRRIAMRAKETNPTKEKEDKSLELLEQWEDKIKKARQKRQQLLLQKANAM